MAVNYLAQLEIVETRRRFNIGRGVELSKKKRGRNQRATTVYITRENRLVFNKCYFTEIMSAAL